MICFILLPDAQTTRIISPNGDRDFASTRSGYEGRGVLKFLFPVIWLVQSYHATNIFFGAELTRAIQRFETAGPCLRGPTIGQLLAKERQRKGPFFRTVEW
jgi:hypothetical protein